MIAIMVSIQIYGKESRIMTGKSDLVNACLYKS